MSARGSACCHASVKCVLSAHLGLEQAQAELVLVQVLAQQSSQAAQVLLTHQGPLPGLGSRGAAGLRTPGPIYDLHSVQRCS